MGGIGDAAGGVPDGSCPRGAECGWGMGGLGFDKAGVPEADRVVGGGWQFGEFVKYLQERDRAGVVKLPPEDPPWPRMLYVMPCSPEACKLFGIPTQPSECLLALCLPTQATGAH